MNIEFIVKWKIKESETDRILKMLPELAEKSKKEKGNVSYAIYQSDSADNELILHEQYTDVDAVEAHKQSVHYQTIIVNEIIPHLTLREVMRVRKLL
jgi:quinol monooxygenase YgiN